MLSLTSEITLKPLGNSLYTINMQFDILSSQINTNSPYTLYL